LIKLLQDGQGRFQNRGSTLLSVSADVYLRDIDVNRGVISS